MLRLLVEVIDLVQVLAPSSPSLAAALAVFQAVFHAREMELK